ncbi:hypothetical protein HK102_002002 [Quaeritorhiza haematococci]|nr:hypothetical protein HK102_002002 [Quaeritorhiza haematococci]
MTEKHGLRVHVVTWNVATKPPSSSDFPAHDLVDLIAPLPVPAPPQHQDQTPPTQTTDITEDEGWVIEDGVVGTSGSNSTATNQKTSSPTSLSPVQHQQPAPPDFVTVGLQEMISQPAAFLLPAQETIYGPKTFRKLVGSPSRPSSRRPSEKDVSGSVGGSSNKDTTDTASLKSFSTSAFTASSSTAYDPSLNFGAGTALGTMNTPSKDVSGHVLLSWVSHLQRALFAAYQQHGATYAPLLAHRDIAIGLIIFVRTDKGGCGGFVAHDSMDEEGEGEEDDDEDEVESVGGGVEECRFRVLGMRIGSIGIGLGGVYGNKGAVGCSLDVQMIAPHEKEEAQQEGEEIQVEDAVYAPRDIRNVLSLCFVASHLSAHEGQQYFLKRNEEVSYLFDCLVLNPVDEKTIASTSNTTATTTTETTSAPVKSRGNSKRTASSRRTSWWNYATQMTGLFPNLDATHGRLIRDHDCVWFLGDFNYRLQQRLGSSVAVPINADADNAQLQKQRFKEEVCALIDAGDFEKLLSFDELRSLISLPQDESSGGATGGVLTLQCLSGFEESRIRFLPTYKYVMTKGGARTTPSAADDAEDDDDDEKTLAESVSGQSIDETSSGLRQRRKRASQIREGLSDQPDQSSTTSSARKASERYSHKRLPAYCDRILFRCTGNPPTSSSSAPSSCPSITCTPEHYAPCQIMTGYSDHQPVVAVFSLLPSQSTSTSASTMILSDTTKTSESPEGSTPSSRRVSTSTPISTATLTRSMKRNSTLLRESRREKVAKAVKAARAVAMWRTANVVVGANASAPGETATTTTTATGTSGSATVGGAAVGGGKNSKDIMNVNIDVVKLRKMRMKRVWKRLVLPVVFLVVGLGMGLVGLLWIIGFVVRG